MDIMLEKWASGRGTLEFWRHRDHWNIHEYVHAGPHLVHTLESYEIARTRLGSLLQHSDYKKVFDISTVEKQMEFQILKDGKYVSVDGGDLLTDLKQ
jgi:hypothetical protein